jgi:hypothetical protein
MVRAEVVGVVADLRHQALDRPISQEVFVPHAQVPLNDMTFVARSSGEPLRLLAGLTSSLRNVAPNQAIYRTATLPDLVSASSNERRFILTLVLAFALLAAALAASGVYGVMSVVSVQRTKEYGLRMALGAGRGEILRMVMREAITVTGVGLAIGLVGALIAGQLLRSFLLGIGPTDEPVFVFHAPTGPIAKSSVSLAYGFCCATTIVVCAAVGAAASSASICFPVAEFGRAEPRTSSQGINAVLSWQYEHHQDETSTEQRGAGRDSEPLLRLQAVIDLRWHRHERKYPES